MNNPYNQPYYVPRQLLRIMQATAHKECPMQLPTTMILTNKITVSLTEQDTIVMANGTMDTITTQDVMIAVQL